MKGKSVNFLCYVFLVFSIFSTNLAFADSTDMVLDKFDSFTGILGQVFSEVSDFFIINTGTSAKMVAGAYNSVFGDLYRFYSDSYKSTGVAIRNISSVYKDSAIVSLKNANVASVGHVEPNKFLEKIASDTWVNIINITSAPLIPFFNPNFVKND